MKSIFALQETSKAARDCVDGLLEEGFEESEINVIVQEEVAKGELDLNLTKANVKATDELGEKRLKGLDAILAGEQYDELPQLGRVYAAGDFANLIARNASGSDIEPKSLAGALRELGVEEGAANRYHEGIDGGGYLLILRVEEDRAHVVTSVFNKSGAVEVGSYPKSS